MKFFYLPFKSPETFSRQRTYSKIAPYKLFYSFPDSKLPYWKAVVVKMAPNRRNFHSNIPRACKSSFRPLDDPVIAGANPGNGLTVSGRYFILKNLRDAILQRRNFHTPSYTNCVNLQALETLRRRTLYFIGGWARGAQDEKYCS